MRIAKAGVIVLFLLLLCAPALQMLSGAVPVPPLDENRRRAPLPTLSDLSRPSAFVAGMQAWFDDHYGLRDLLIRAKAQMDFSMFSSSERLHIGRDGFLFYRSVIDQEEPRVERMSDVELDKAVQKILEVRDYLSSKGVHLIVQTNQLKDKFYPEYLPHEAQFARNRHQFDKFRAKLAAASGMTYFDTTPTLMQLKTVRPVFHKTDFHWNDPAALVCARELVDRIAKLDGKPAGYWKHELKVQTIRFSGGQALFMPLFQPPTEMGLFVDPNWDGRGYAADEHSPPFEIIYSRRPPVAGLLPTTVVFGDSFVDGMVRAGLPASFDTFAYARLYQASLADVLRALPVGTKYFVLEFIEVALPNIAAMDIPRAS